MQNFIIIEITRNDAGNIAVYPSAREEEGSAYNKYYEILTRASTSNSPVHGAVLMNYNGFKLEQKCFIHDVQPEPEPEPEPEPTPEVTEGE